MTKLYLITYRPQSNFNPTTFHSYINSMYEKKWFSDWWHYTDNAYIVASEHTAEKIYSGAVPGMTGIKHVLVIEVDPKNTQGWLPKDAWTWLSKYK